MTHNLSSNSGIQEDQIMSELFPKSLVHNQCTVFEWLTLRALHNSKDYLHISSVASKIGKYGGVIAHGLEID